MSATQTTPGGPRGGAAPGPRAWRTVAAHCADVYRSLRRRLSRWAPGPRAWRTVDIVSAAVLAVAGGLLFATANVVLAPVWTGLYALYPPLDALVIGLWLLPGVLGGLVIRRPGAALFVELVAAVVSMLVGTQWGLMVAVYGLLQGLGAELVFAAGRYRRFGAATATLAGALAGLGSGIWDALALGYVEISPVVGLLRVVVAVVSGAVLAGLVGHWLTRALARTGALDALPSGRSARRV